VSLLRKVLFAGRSVTDGFPTVALNSKNLSSTVNSPDVARVGIRLLADGTLQTLQGTPASAYVSDADEWGLPRNSGTGAVYEARMRMVSGSWSSGPTTWVSLGSTRTWELSRSAGGNTTVNAELEIRRSGVIVATAPISASVGVVTATLRLTPKDLFGFAFTGATSSAAIRLLSDGTLQTRGGTTAAAFTSDSSEWALPRSGATGPLYEARMVLVSGVAPSGTMNTWLQLNATREE